MIDLIGFCPDLPSNTPGIFTDCNNFVPTNYGFESAKSGIPIASVPAIPSKCIGAAVVENLDGARRVIAGTSTRLYELQNSSWANVSRPLNYSLGADDSWSICQIGNTTIASSSATKIQRSDGGAFSDIAQAPKAKIVFAVNYYLVALGIDDGANRPSGWACSDRFDINTWNASPSNLSDSGDLLGAPGKITAGEKLGDFPVAYKENAIFIGSWVESNTQTIDWRQITGSEAGCIGQDALCSIDDAHFFVGKDNFWIFDGSRANPIGEDKIRQWFFTNSSPSLRYKTKCVFDRQNSRIYIFYCSNSSQILNSGIVFSLVSKQWGVHNFSITSAFNYISSSTTIDGLNNFAPTIATLPSAPMDSQYWLFGGRSLAYFDQNNQVNILGGAPGDSSFTTGDFGDDQTISMLRKIRLRFAAGKGPSLANCVCFYKFNNGDNFVAGSSSTINDGKFDARQSGRFHRAKILFNGPVKVESISAELRENGQR